MKVPLNALISSRALHLFKRAAVILEQRLVRLKAMSAGSVLLQISTQADTCNASGLSLQHSSISPKRASYQGIRARYDSASSLSWNCIAAHLFIFNRNKKN